MSKGQMNDMFRQMEELFSKVNKLENDLDIQKQQHKKEIKKLKKEHKKEINQLNKKILEKDKQIEKLTSENQKLKTEIIRLKNQNKKDSSNSSKPSGTNGFKKVITNRREKLEHYRKGGKTNEEIDPSEVD